MGEDASILSHATIVFLDDQERDGSLGCWAYIGQHGTCSRNWVLKETRNATAEEAAAAIHQWRSEGPDREPDKFRLRVLQRMSR